MRSFFLSALLAGAAVPLTNALLRGPPPVIIATPESGICINNDLSDFLKTNIRKARPFCREYLNNPASASYVATVTPVETALSTETVTTTFVVSTTVVNVETSVLTSTETTVVSTATITVEPTVTITARNQQIAEFSDILAANYAHASISSACSCLPTRGCQRKGSTKTASAATTTLASTLTVEDVSTWITTSLTTTTTETTTTLPVTTTTEVPAPQTTSFHAAVYLDGSTEKKYLASISDGQNSGYLYLTTDIALATTFTIDSERRLMYNDPGFSAPITPIWQDSMNTPGLMYYLGVSTLANLAFSTVDKAHEWSIDEATNALTIVGDGNVLTLGTYTANIAPMGVKEYIIQGPVPHPSGFGPDVSSMVAELI